MADITYTKKQVQEIGKSLIGKTFGELNNYEMKAEMYSKGSHGHILEENVFCYGKNNNSAPDFENIGIELKVTPYKVNKDGTLSAKERLVLNIINYMEEYKNSFYNSHFWYKNRLIQIIWYIHDDNIDKSNFKITHELLFSFPEDDLPIIIQDWETIIEKIKTGKAHEISEADTFYLGACTKGASSDTVRKQPFSDILAKQRAFCLKTSYMSELVRSYIGGEKLEKFISPNKLKKKSFEDNILEVITPYIGLTQKQLMSRFNIDSTAKNLNEILICRMFGINSDLSKTDEFIKANIKAKTIRIQYGNHIKESLPFPAFDYLTFANEEWENCELRNMFLNTKFMFFFFNEEAGEYHFSGIKLWNISIKDLDGQVRKVWEKTKDVVVKGNIVSYISDKGIRRTNFPGMKNNPICHVRPHAKTANDTNTLPITDKVTGSNEYTKHSFWLNATYLVKIFKDYK